jgi:hypothetical protein
MSAPKLFRGSVVRLTRRGRAKTRAEILQARIEADTEAAVSALLETQPDQHRAAVLRAAHKVVTRQLAKIEGPYTTASLLGAEAYRLCPPEPRSTAVAQGEAVFAVLTKRAGGAA